MSELLSVARLGLPGDNGVSICNVCKYIPLVVEVCMGAGQGAGPGGAGARTDDDITFCAAQSYR